MHTPVKPPFFKLNLPNTDRRDRSTAGSLFAAAAAAAAATVAAATFAILGTKMNVAPEDIRQETTSVRRKRRSNTGSATSLDLLKNFTKRFP